jgi:threonine/homoserine/homoserine lactone efflux protein
MEYFFAFTLAFIISLFGSVQPGPVNLAVLTSSIQRKYKNAFFIALGGSWPEFMFSFIAFKLAAFVVVLPIFITYFKIAIIIVLIILAVYLWFSKANISVSVSNKNGFVLGSLLAILNPQLILFWLAAIAYIQTNQILNLFHNNYVLLFFCLGAMVGALVFHILLIYLSKRWFGNMATVFLKYADKIVASIFAFLAIFQTIKIFN